MARQHWMPISHREKSMSRKKWGRPDFFFLTRRSAFERVADMKKVKKTKPVPLPIPIPSDYAVKLGVDQSYVSHVNAGRKHFGILTTFMFLKLAHKDPRVAGLTIIHLRPDFEEFLPYICTPYILSRFGSKD